MHSLSINRAEQNDYLEKYIMQAFNYENTDYPIRSDLQEANRYIWNYLSKPGSWWTAQEKIDIAQEVRQATNCTFCQQRKEAISPYAIQGAHERGSELPDAVVDTVHRIVTDSSRLTSDWMQKLEQVGISKGHYIELLGIVVFIINIDTLHKGLDIPLEPFPQPLNGQPSRYEPGGLVKSDAWVSMLNMKQLSTQEADLYGDIHNKPTNVLLALSTVPDSVRCQRYLENRYYLPPSNILNARDNADRAISRQQIEFVASRVSANNQCFYCTTSHSMMYQITAEVNGDKTDFSAITNAVNADCKDESSLISNFIDQLMQGDDATIKLARQAIDQAISSAASVEIAGLVGSFQRMNRIANATGIALDSIVNAMSGEVQRELNLRNYETSKASRNSNPIFSFLMAKFRSLLFRLLSKKKLT